MKNRRPILFWTIFGLFIALAAWWSLYSPYDPARLYAALPDNVEFISEHDDLASRWRDMARNRVVLSVLAGAGVEQVEVDELLADVATGVLVDRLTSRRTVVGYVPRFADTGRPAWVIASWGGIHSRLMRWGVSLGGLPDLEPEKLPGGRRVWRYEDPEAMSDEHLSVAVAEGVLFGCWSADPTGVRHLVDRVERGDPAVPEFRLGRAAGLPSLGGPDGGAPRDRGWLRMDRGQGFDHRRYRVRWALSVDDEYTASGWMRGDQGLLAPFSVCSPADRSNGETTFGGFDGLVGDAPDVVMAMPVACVDPVTTAGVAPPAVGEVAGILRAASGENAVLVASLLSGEYSGRILVKIPTLIAGMKLLPEASTDSVVAALLDRVNARYGWSLIPFSRDVNGQTLIVLESSQRSFYGKLGADGKPAFVRRGDWLAFSSNAAALSRLLSHAHASGYAVAAEGPKWRPRDADGDAALYGWFDFDAAGDAVGKAIAAYSLVLMMSGEKRDAATRRQLEEVSAWLVALSPLQTCSVGARGNDTEFEVRFRLGGRPNPEVAAIAR